MKVKVKIYDFDHTLVDGDSIFLLWKYALKKGWVSPWFAIKSFLKGGIFYCMTGRFEKMKEGMIALLPKLSQEEMDAFVEDLLREKGFPAILSTIEEEGYVTILCSASPKAYMELVAQRLGFDYLIATEHQGGKLTGKNNTGEEKARRLRELFQTMDMDVDPTLSKSYTDNPKKDGPMCSFTNQRFVINKTAEGYVTLNDTSGTSA
ncbi:MAG: HAD family hydrolase [Tissierellia bacterium]|nr:HAD family hydrolase [Tissierellia bacterium]